MSSQGLLPQGRSLAQDANRSVHGNERSPPAGKLCVCQDVPLNSNEGRPFFRRDAIPTLMSQVPVVR